MIPTPTRHTNKTSLSSHMTLSITLSEPALEQERATKIKRGGGGPWPQPCVSQKQGLSKCACPGICVTRSGTQPHMYRKQTVQSSHSNAATTTAASPGNLAFQDLFLNALKGQCKLFYLMTKKVLRRSNKKCLQGSRDPLRTVSPTHTQPTNLLLQAIVFLSLCPHPGSAPRAAGAW